MSGRAQDDLEAAGFPAATRELAYAVPVDELAGGAAELELEITVDGFAEQAARMSVGYLPGGPVTAGQQLVQRGERRGAPAAAGGERPGVGHPPGPPPARRRGRRRRRRRGRRQRPRRRR